MQSFHWICMPWKRGLSKKIFFDEKITAKNSKYWIWIQKSSIWINFRISCHLRGGPRDTAELGRRVSWRLRSGRAYVSPNVTTLHTAAADVHMLNKTHRFRAAPCMHVRFMQVCCFYRILILLIRILFKTTPAEKPLHNAKVEKRG